MKKIFTILILSSLFAGELEVDGNLTVTEGVNASSFVGDGSGLTNLPSLGDMKPERIYSFKRYDHEDFSLTVPEGKLWILQMFYNFNIRINDTHYNMGTEKFSILPGWTLEPDDDSKFFLNIYEYSISGSGTDQGIDYIVP